MKKDLHILIGNTKWTVRMEEGEALNNIIDDLKSGTSENIEFKTELGTRCYLKRGLFAGYILADYVQPIPDKASEERAKQSGRITALLEKAMRLMGQGDEWRGI